MSVEKDFGWSAAGPARMCPAISVSPAAWGVGAGFSGSGPGLGGSGEGLGASGSGAVASGVSPVAGVRALRPGAGASGERGIARLQGPGGRWQPWHGSGRNSVSFLFDFHLPGHSPEGGLSLPISGLVLTFSGPLFGQIPPSGHSTLKPTSSPLLEFR